MISLSRSTSQLVNDVLEGGLSRVGSYIEEVLNKPIIIMDGRGIIYYPDNKSARVVGQELLLQISHCATNELYHYQMSEKQLFYPIACHHTFAYVIIDNLPSDTVGFAVNVLEEAKLAIKCYFSITGNNFNNLHFKEEELMEDVFSNRNLDIEELIKINNPSVDINTQFYVLINEINDVMDNINLKRIALYSKRYLASINLDIITYSYGNYIVAIIPAHLASAHSKSDTVPSSRLLKYYPQNHIIFKIGRTTLDYWQSRHIF